MTHSPQFGCYFIASTSTETTSCERNVLSGAIKPYLFYFKRHSCVWRTSIHFIVMLQRKLMSSFCFFKQEKRGFMTPLLYWKPAGKRLEKSDAKKDEKKVQVTPTASSAWGLLFLNNATGYRNISNFFFEGFRWFLLYFSTFNLACTNPRLQPQPRRPFQCYSSSQGNNWTPKNSSLFIKITY